MELSRLIESLSRPAAYPYPVDSVEVRQTHISAVFLAGAYVYKVKKPVIFDFLDFGTLDRRRHFCAEEARLNRRLAADVYRGVVPITADGDQLRVEGEGEAVEWAVKMRRLPEEATLKERVQRGAVGIELVESLACRIASFHQANPTGPEKAAFARFDAVARNIREVLREGSPQVGLTVSAAVHKRLGALIEESLSRLRPLIEERAARGVPRDAHGDLHLDHVYHFPDRPPPEDLLIIDCIEFSERLRYIDPVADMAFLAMDLAFRGRRDLARAFTAEYFRATGDEEGKALLPLYTAYRAAVRGMVEGLKLGEKEVPDEERRATRASARGHWLLALAEIEQPDRRPCLLLVGGLPGSGKSTLGRGLAERAGFERVRSDEVRKELASRSPSEQIPSDGLAELYSPEWTERTYAECLRRAESLLFEGKRVLVDATFREEVWRRAFLEMAVCWGVPALLLICHASPDVVRARIAGRRGDASDADWSVYEMAARQWQEPSPETRKSLRAIDTTGSRAEALQQTLDALRAWA